MVAITVSWKLLKTDTSDTTQTEIQKAHLIPSLQPLEQTLEKQVEQARDLLTHVVKPGDTFYGILSQFNVPPEKANDIYKSLKPLGLPALFPGDSLIVETGAEGEFQNLELLSKRQVRYQVTYHESMIRAEKRPLIIHSYNCLVNGTLETSLSEEMNKYGVGAIIASKFADIFAWDINFFLDPRKGDYFQILFTQKYAEGRFAGYGEILAARYINNGKEFLAFGFPDYDGKLKYYDQNGKSVQKQFLKAPLMYSRISSGFSHGRKHPILGIVRPHLGIDYAAPTGTPVYAAADGRVTFSGRNGGYGNMVILSHSGAYETYYGHLHRIQARNGSHVKQGDLIGTVGSTGLSTGPHLDYRMKRNGQFVNPITLSLPSDKSIDKKMQAEYERVQQTYSAAFEHRFAQKAGLYIIDIETVASEEPQTHQVSRNSTGSLYGNTSGS